MIFERECETKDPTTEMDKDQITKDEESLETGRTAATEIDMEADDDSNDEAARRGRRCFFIFLLWLLAFYASLFLSIKYSDNWFLTVASIIVSLSPVVLCIFGCCFQLKSEGTKIGPAACYTASVNRIC
jgi:hypothetical protein